MGGNHTDHNNGKVLAAAVNLDVIAAVKKTENGVIRLKSVGFPMDTVDTADLNVQEAEKGALGVAHPRRVRTLKGARL